MHRDVAIQPIFRDVTAVDACHVSREMSRLSRSLEHNVREMFGQFCVRLYIENNGAYDPKTKTFGVTLDSRPLQVELPLQLSCLTIVQLLPSGPTDTRSALFPI